MSVYTPGPWEWWTSNSWRRLRRSERGVSTNILLPTIHRDHQPDIDVTPEDMALIAAAPDMLAALKLCDKTYWATQERPSVVDEAAAMNAARVAIAKAEGKP